MNTLIYFDANPDLKRELLVGVRDACSLFLIGLLRGGKPWNT